MSVDTQPPGQVVDEVDTAADQAGQVGSVEVGTRQEPVDPEPIEVGEENVDQVDEQQLAADGALDVPRSHRARNYGATSLLAMVTAAFAATGLWWLAAIGGAAALGVGALVVRRTGSERRARQSARRASGIGRVRPGGGRSSGSSQGKKPGLLGRLLGRGPGGGTAGNRSGSGQGKGGRNAGGKKSTPGPGGKGKPGLLGRLLGRGPKSRQDGKASGKNSKNAGGKKSTPGPGGKGKPGLFRRLLNSRKKPTPDGKGGDGKSAKKPGLLGRLLGRAKKSGTGTESTTDGGGSNGLPDKKKAGKDDIAGEKAAGGNAGDQGGSAGGQDEASRQAARAAQAAATAATSGRGPEMGDVHHDWTNMLGNTYNGESAMDFRKFSGDLPEALGDFATHYKKQFAGATDSVYIKAGTQERMEALGQAMTALSSHADEVDTMFRREHQDKLDDIDEGDSRKAAWDISRNR